MTDFDRKMQLDFMKQNRLYSILKFASKEDALIILKQKLNYLADADLIINLLNNSKLNDSIINKIIGRLMGEISREPQKINFKYVESIINEFENKSKDTDKSFQKQKEHEAINKSDIHLKNLLQNNSDEKLIREYSAKLGISFYKLIIGILEKNSSLSFSDFKEIIDKAKSFPVKYQEWLNSRFGIKAKINEIHPIQDCLPTLEEYSEKENGIVAKYKDDEEFRNNFKNKFEEKLPNEIMLFSSDDLVNIIDLYLLDNLSINASSVKKLLTLPQEDLIASVGEWDIWSPSSKENSCAIARVNPKTLDPLTEWCTARTKSENLFYNYNGDSKLLFYIIKKNPVSDNDWLSIGFKDKNIVFNGNATESVNRVNKGLTYELLQSILGNNYENIMTIIQEKNNKLEGKSPAYKKIEEAATDIDKYYSLIQEATEQDKLLLKQKVAIITKNQDILLEMSNDPHYKVRARVAANINADKAILERLLLDSNESVSVAAYNNENLVLDYLSIDKQEIIEFIFSNVGNSDVTWDLFQRLDRETIINILNQWDSEKIDIRLRKSTIGNLDQEAIKQIALNSECIENKRAAINELNDVDALKEIVKNESEKSERDPYYGYMKSSLTLAEIKLKEVLSASENKIAKNNFKKITKISKAVNLFYKNIQAISKF